MQRERRQSPRVEILGELLGHAIVLDEPVEIRAMSAGGFTMVTTSPFMIGSVHAFRLIRGESESLLVHGRIVHRRGWFEGDEPRHIAGVQFVEVTQGTAAWIEDFMNSLQVPIS